MEYAFICDSCSKTMVIDLDFDPRGDIADEQWLHIMHVLADRGWFYSINRTALCDDEAPDPEEPSWK